MDISAYHQKYASQSDDEIRKRAAIKEMELSRVFKATGYKTTSRPARVAIMGSGDKRFLRYHKSMFQSLIGSEVNLVTFDISVEHLSGAEGVVRHDVTIPLPNAPYDITYGHLLLKFIETEKQWLALRNSYDALRSPGIAIHIIHEEEIVTEQAKMPDGFFGVPLARWEEKLAKEGVTHSVVPLRIEGMSPQPIIARALVLIK